MRREQDDRNDGYEEPALPALPDLFDEPPSRMALAPVLDEAMDAYFEARLPSEYVERHSGQVSPREMGRKVMVAYLRASTERQVASVPAQRIAAEEYAREVKATSLVFEVDDGLTGTNMDERPGINSALDRFVAGSADIFWVFRASRASREASDLLKIWSVISRAKAEFHTTDRKRIGRLEILFEAAYGEVELEKIKGQLSQGVTNMIMKGRVMNLPPFGFGKHAHIKGTHFPREDRARHVKWAFEQRVAGVSPTVIARSLSEKRVPTPSEARMLDREEITIQNCRCRWTGWMVNGLFDKTVYMGYVTYRATEWVRDPRTNKKLRKRKRPRSEWIEKYNRHLVIVPPPLWHLVFAIRRTSHWSNSRKEGDPRPLTYLFTGRQFCGRPGCGSRMKIYVAEPAPAPPSLKCETSIALPDQCAGCGLHGIDAVERLVVGAVRDEILRPDMIEIYEEQYAYNAHRMITDLRRRREELVAEAARCQSLFDGSFDKGSMAGFDAEQEALQRQRITERKRRAEAALKDLPEEPDVRAGLERLATLPAALDRVIELAPFRPEDAAGRQVVAALRALVSRIVISPPTAAGIVRIDVHSDVEQLVGAEVGQASLFPMQEVTSLVYDLDAENSARRAARAARKRDEREARAAQATRDLSDAAWERLEPLMRTVEPADRAGVRNVVDGMLHLAREQDKFHRLPTRFSSDHHAFKLAVKRLIWSNAWDECREVLEREFPAFVEGAELAMYDTTSYKRKGASGRFSAMTGDDIRALAGEETRAIVKKRLIAVSHVQDGRQPEAVAPGTGFKPYTITTWHRSFQAIGPAAVGGPEKGKGVKLLTRAQVLSLKPFIEKGVNPYFPGKRIDLETMRLHVEKTFGRKSRKVPIGAILRQNGIGLRVVAHAVAVAKVKSMSGPGAG